MGWLRGAELGDPSMGCVPVQELGGLSSPRGVGVAPCSAALQRSQSIINCVSSALAPAFSGVSAGQVGWGHFGEKKGVFHIRKLLCLGERRCCARAPPRTWGQPGLQGSHVLCFVPRAQGWCPHGCHQGCFWLCHEGSRDSCATPWPGESPCRGLQVEDGTLQHKATTHPPKRATSLLGCVLPWNRGLSHAL